MALNKVVDVDQMGKTAPNKSALQTFANIMNAGTSLAGLASEANSTFNPATTKPLYQPAPSGTYSLGQNLDFSQNGVNPTWMDTLQHPYFSNVGQESNPMDLGQIKNFGKNPIVSR